MKKLLLPLAILASLWSFAQVPATSQEHLFTGGDLSGLTQTGSALTQETDRLGVSSDAISLNGDHLTRANINSPYMSISFWVKTTTNDATVRTIIDQTERTSSANNSGERGWYTYLQNGKVSMGGNFYYAYYYGVYPSGEFRTFHSGYYFATSTTDVTDGDWHHVMATAEPIYQGGTSLKYDYKIYIDGVLEDTERVEVLVSPNTLSYSLTPSNPIVLGNNSSGNLTDRYQDGMDDVRFYGRSMTNFEIEELAKEGICSFPRTINVSNVQETSASIDWVSNDLPSSWELSYVPSGGLPDNGTIVSNITQKEFELTGLSSNSSYEVYIRAICGGSPTAWSNPVQLTTSNIVYVDVDATGANDGTSWDDAYNNLSTAIASASSSDFIWVAEGTYVPGNYRTAAFILNHQKLFGGFNGTETGRHERNPAINRTILSGDVLGNDSGNLNDTETTRQDNIYHVIALFGSATDVLVDGFVIKGGNANGAVNTNCGSGGFGQYYRTRGAAVYAHPTQVNQTITATFRNCVIEENTASSVSVYSTFVPCGITGTTIDVDFESCIIKNNYSNLLPAFLFSGSSGYSNLSKGSIVNSLLYDNISNSGASCVYLGTSTANGGNATGIDVDIINSTFADNTGLNGNVITMLRASNSTIQNSIIYDNGSVTPFDITSTGSVVSNSIVEGGQQGGTDTDPLFNDVLSDDFTLSCASAAIDAGDASGLSLPEKDLAGNTRENGTIDMGAYEFSEVLHTSITAVVKDITVYLDANGDAIIAPEDVDDGSGSTCGTEVVFSLDNTTFSCANIGPNTVILTATEVVGGASDAASATVTVIDDIAPVVSVQNITASLDASGNVVVTPAQVDNGSTDNCTSFSNLILSLDQTAFNCADLGANQVTLTVEDESGNTSTASATVTIVDDMAPTVVGQNLTLSLDANGDANLSAAQLDNGSSDNCTSAGNLVMSIDKSSFTCSDLGINQVELTVTDESGNQTSAMFDVIIEDNTAPAAVAQNLVVQLGSNGQVVVDPLAINNGSSDNCGITYSLDQNTFTCADVGVNNVLFTATDNAGNQSTVSATVTVEDNIAPNVIAQNLTVQLDANGLATVTPESVDNGSSDNCSGTLLFSLSQTDFSCADLGVNTETLTVTDVNGNQSTAQVFITIEDATAPSVVAQNISVQLDANGEINVSPQSLDNGSSDNCTAQGSLTFALDQTYFDCNDVGANTVTLTVTDGSGNSSTASAIITVEDVTNPIVSAQNVTVKLNQNNEATVFATDIDTGSSDNCGVTLSMARVSQFARAAPSGPSLIFTEADIGNNSVELTASDLSGNRSSTTITVTVEPYKLDQTITFDAIPDQVYGNSDISLSAISSSGLPVSYSIISGSAVTLSGNTLSIVGSSSVTIEASQAGNGDYNPATSVQRYFTITKASLTATAENKAMSYGDDLPELTISYSGFVNGENASDLDSEPTVTADFGGQVVPNAGSYDLVVTGGSSDNYELTLVNGILTINKVDQVITIQPIDDKQPDDAPFSITATVDSGLELDYDISGPASISGTTISLDGTEGTVTMTVSQAGDQNHNSATEEISFNVMMPLAIGDDLENSVNIYPNPFVDHLTIEGSQLLNVRLSSLDGKILKSLDGSEGLLDLSDLKNGIYLLEISNEEERIIKRIIKTN